MKTPFKPLFLLAMAALLLAQFVAVAAGQDTQEQQSTQRPERKKNPRPPDDNSDIKLPSFSLEIKADKTIAAVGEKLKIEVTLTNTSDQDIFYDGYGNQRPFGLDVRDEMGGKVAETEEGAIADGVGGSVFAAPIHPGESIHRFARLDKEFKLDKPGNYFVQAARGVSITNRVTSNTITIAITQ